MKAKVKSTGEIIEVSEKYDSGYHEWKYTNVISNERYSSSELDFKDLADWEERRFQASKSILAALMSNTDYSISDEELCGYSIELADELIKQLKEK